MSDFTFEDFQTVAAEVFAEVVKPVLPEAEYEVTDGADVRPAPTSRTLFFRIWPFGKKDPTCASLAAEIADDDGAPFPLMPPTREVAKKHLMEAALREVVPRWLNAKDARTLRELVPVLPRCDVCGQLATLHAVMRQGCDDHRAGAMSQYPWSELIRSGKLRRDS
jgi:hypothetical protein